MDITQLLLKFAFCANVRVPCAKLPQMILPSSRARLGQSESVSEMVVSFCAEQSDDSLCRPRSPVANESIHIICFFREKKSVDMCRHKHIAEYLQPALLAVKVQGTYQYVAVKLWFHAVASLSQKVCFARTVGIEQLEVVFHIDSEEMDWMVWVKLIRVSHCHSFLVVNPTRREALPIADPTPLHLPITVMT